MRKHKSPFRRKQFRVELPNRLRRLETRRRYRSGHAPLRGLRLSMRLQTSPPALGCTNLHTLDADIQRDSVPCSDFVTKVKVLKQRRSRNPPSGNQWLVTSLNFR